MRKKLGQIVCMMLAAMMVFTIFAALPVSAAEVEIWQAPSGGLKANTAVKAFEGITITAAEDNKKSSGATVDGTKFDASYQAVNKAEVSKDESSGEITMTGAAYKIETERSGKLSVPVTLSNGKGMNVKSADDFDNMLYEYKNETGADVVTFHSFDIEAGGTYYFWFTGTKPRVYGLTFKELVSSPAVAGNKVTVAATPNEKGLLGNVRLDDENITLEKNSDMTLSTFTMPEKDVTVYVDFVSKDVQKEVDSVSFDEIKGANTSENEVYDSLVLFDGWQTSIGYADVSWESSNEEVVSKSGEVNAKSRDTKVDLTAVFSYQDYPNIFLYRTFNLTVPADNDDEGAVAAAKEALTLGDTSVVKKNLELPVKGRRNTVITWTSSNPQIVAEDGSVNPSYDEEITVTLIATITRGSASDTKEFVIVVPKIVPVEFRRAAISNSDGDVVITPTEGCYLSHIVYIGSITNLTGDETISAFVTTKGDTKTADFKIKDSEKAENKNADETIIYLDKDALPVGADSQITLTAYEDSAKTKPFPAGTYEYKPAEVPDGATIYVSGDSTACTYPATGKSNRFPQTGWAAVLGDYFTGVTVNDLALSGRSSLDFLKEGNYNTIKNKIKPGDYFIIQFGHNDSKTGDTTRYTDPKGDRFTEGSYKKNMIDNYVNIALDKGAYPILTSSISRRKTSDTSLEQYVNATKEMGKELGLPVVDLYGKVVDYNNRVGVEKAKDIYNYVKPKDSRFTGVEAGDFANSQYYKEGTTDDTHINYFGAQMISQWFCDELERLGHPLLTKRNDHITEEEKIPSYAGATSASVATAEDSKSVMTVKAGAAADGGYKVIYEYNDTLGTVEVYTGDGPIPDNTPTPGPSEEPLPESYEIKSAVFEGDGLKVDYASGEGEAIIVVATYENEAITAADVFDADNSGSQNLEYPKPESGETKVFIWDSRDKLVPLCEPYTVKQTP